MAIRTGNLGGINWGGEALSAAELVATINAANGNNEISEQFEISATDTNTTQAFSNNVNGLEIYNHGPNTVYLSPNGAATTSSLSVESGRSLIVRGRLDSAGLICDSGETAEVLLFALDTTTDSANATLSSENVTSTSSSFSINNTQVLIKNEGSSVAYISINDPATTSSYPIQPLDIVRVNPDNISTLYAVCDSGDSTTLTVIK